MRVENAGLEHRPAVTVQGRARLSARPDLIVLTLSVRGFDLLYPGAVDELNRRVTSLRQNLEKAGIEQNLETTGFHVRERTRWMEFADEETSASTSRRRTEVEGEEIFVGYEAHHNLKLALPIDQELVNRAFSAMGEGEGHPRVSISFDVQDREALRQRVLHAAVEDACRSAQTMARAAAIRLGTVVKVDYGALDARPARRPSRYEVMADAAGPAPDIIPSDIQIQEEVTVVWELEG